MPPSVLWRLAVFALALVCGLPSDAEVRAVGPEIPVNLGKSSAHDPQGVRSPDGRVLFVWEDRSGVVGRFFTEDGRPASGELHLLRKETVAGPGGATTQRIYTHPDAAFLSNGDLLVAASEGVTECLSSGPPCGELLARIVLRRFTPPAWRAAPIQAVGGAGIGFSSPRLLARGDRPLVVVWPRRDAFIPAPAARIVGRTLTRFTGRPFGEIFDISADVGENLLPSVAGLPDGRFLVAWHEATPLRVRALARAFVPDAEGRPQPRAIEVLGDDPGVDQSFTSIAPDGTRGYLAAWVAAPDGLPGRVVVRFVGGDGAPAGAALPISSGGSSRELPVTVRSLPGGGFFAAWAAHVEPAFEEQEVVGRVLGADGNPLGAQLAISRTRRKSIEGLPALPSVVGDRSLLVAWHESTPTRGSIVTARRVVLAP